jgi:dynein assembly factor 1
MLSNRFLWDLFKKEHRKYYRTPSLNEKLFLHYKGFSYIRNMEQFTDLKCLYFEGNGCKSMLGLEGNTQLRSLFIQENIIEKMEGLDTLKDLRQLNLAENMLKRIEGLGECVMLDTLYLKRNRIGKDEIGDVESLRGLLERPTLTCVDLQDNYISDPAILDEILAKMPNLAVLYL